MKKTLDYESPRTWQMPLEAEDLLCASPTTADDLNEKYDWSSDIWGS